MGAGAALGLEAAEGDCERVKPAGHTSAGLRTRVEPVQEACKPAQIRLHHLVGAATLIDDSAGADADAGASTGC